MAAANADEHNEGVIIRRPRVFKDRFNPLEVYGDFELIRRYRLDRDGIKYVTDLIADEVSPATYRNHSVPAILQTVITLRYLATGCMQLSNADLFGVSQPSVSRIVNRVVSALSRPHNVRRHVSFPRTQSQLRKIQTDLHAIAGFPGTIGVIDGTHVRIISPSVDEPEYVNRKGFHSINVQVCVDSQHKFTDIVARWPGATHDSRILNYSGLKQLLENERLPVSGHLIGDSGYPLKNWLLTPYLRPTTEAERRYNRTLKATRTIVERTIGQWKRRFHVLHSEIRQCDCRLCLPAQLCQR